MSDTQDDFIEARTAMPGLSEALSAVLERMRMRNVGRGLLDYFLTQPEDTAEIAGLIRKYPFFQAAAGDQFIDGRSIIRVTAEGLAEKAIGKAHGGADKAVGWLAKVLTTRSTGITLRAAIWGIETREAQVAPLTSVGGLELLGTSSLADHVREGSRLLGGREMIPKHVASDLPTAAFAIRRPDVPYRAQASTAALDSIWAMMSTARECWDILEGGCAGHPLHILYWFEPDDPDLELEYLINPTQWSHPEILPAAIPLTHLEAADITAIFRQYFCASTGAQDRFRRAVNRATLSQCRRSDIDKVLDLALAFEIAVAGGSQAPPSFKVALRTALLLGGDLAARKTCRATVEDLYRLRNEAAHGGSLDGKSRRKLSRVIEDATVIFRALSPRLLKLSDKPDWNAIELGGGSFAANDAHPER